MRLLSLAVILVSLLALACGPSGGVPVAESPPTPAVTPEPQRTSLEGAFSRAGMDDYLDAIAPLVAQFFGEQYGSIQQPRLVYVPAGSLSRGSCGYSDSWAFSYCPANQTVYAGQDMLWDFYWRAGDAAPAIALAHEFGHHVQFHREVPYSRRASVDFENQADCLSGAWARYAGEQGWLETEDDLRDIGTLMRLIGSAETSRRDHGTTAERRDAFERAYTSGAEACNAYFPDAPVA